MDAAPRPPADPPTDVPDLPLLAVAYDITSSSPMELLSLLRDLCRILWVVDADDPALGAMRRFLGRSGTVFDTGGRSPDDVAAALADHPEPIAGVVAFTDSQLRLAATLSARLGLPGNPLDAVAHLNDKHGQRQAMVDAGLAVPGFCRISAGTTPADAVALADGLRFPVVLKPLQGDSSRDVVALDDAEALEAAVTGLGEHAGLIVEEYLADLATPIADGIGGYLSVESIVVDGDVVPLALTGKFPLAPPFRETGNFMPHPVDTDTATEVLDLSVKAAQALGVRSGALHTEIKLTPDGPRVIEVNGRIGGGAIDLLHTRRFGRSLTELAARVALGLPLDVTAEAGAAHDGPFLYEFFVQPPTDATGLAAIAGLDVIPGTAGATSVSANKSAGDPLDWRRGSQGYVMRVSGVADDLATLGSVPTAVLDAACIEYQTGT